ncbi:DUF5361 domain-containing protein [Nocardia sp. CY41]|uniref:DUF5361 domain-containing protein n=1 Tax=Nocardia sp. CY41 TaxID=2608686 RepID=UPI001F1FB1CB|nr:DUF5361 domain-containing protein [Nocardia sp. CY41]
MRPFRDHAGGILSLDALIEAHPHAIESDLIDRGLRLRDLGTDQLSWGDLRAIVQCARPESALVRATRPTEWQWGLTEHLLADIADSLRWLRWSKTKAAQSRSAQPPQPIQRPGLTDDREKYGTQPMTVTEMDKFLGWKGGE